MPVALRIFLFLAVYIIIHLNRKKPQLFTRPEEEQSAVDKPQNQPVVKRMHKVLLVHNSYYRALSRDGQLKFIARVLFLLPRKRFVGYHDLQVSFEMKVIVLSAQVQLTYGYKRFSLPKFSKYILYPEQFYSRYFERDVKGLTTGFGFITLSWKDVLLGFEDEKDNLNLAIHEISHALEISVVNLPDSELELSLFFQKYQNQVLGHFRRIKKGTHEMSYLREYALANQHEFFAVVVEHFFETPEELSALIPSLYRSLCKLLNQNPMNPTENYRLHA